MSNMTTGTTGSTTQSPMPAGMNPAHPAPRRTRRLSTETKAAYKTTEFLAYIGAVIAVAIASQVIGKDSTAANHVDYFRADKAFLYITILTVGYLLSRGIAKSGSRDFYDDTHNGH
jgi:hypothetical protein